MNQINRIEKSVYLRLIEVVKAAIEEIFNIKTSFRIYDLVKILHVDETVIIDAARSEGHYIIDFPAGIMVLHKYFLYREDME